jgi:hypothetical protein
MFKCQICHKSSKKYERPVMHVVETRDKEYPERLDVYAESEEFTSDDPGGYGYETVREIKVHVGCVPEPDPTALPSSLSRP